MGERALVAQLLADLDELIADGPAGVSPRHIDSVFQRCRTVIAALAGARADGEVADLWAIIRQKERDAYGAANALNVAELDAQCANLALESAALRADVQALRKFVWLGHGCPFPALYGDDGEMSCGRCLVDFKRASVDDIINAARAAEGSL